MSAIYGEQIARGREPGVRELGRHLDDYPALLGTLPDAPDPLYVRGELDPHAPAVAIVGSRDCSPYGRTVTDRLARDLAVAGLVVVSGLARGIDAAAHRATLRAGGRTVAVLPGGIDRIYPPRHRALAASILRAGALVSEHPAGTGIGRWSFPQRNRIIAGLVQLVIVVEAAVRSGARITARLALDYGREVLVVPGPVTSPVSRGCHDLLTEGAHPCGGAEDVLGLLPPETLAILRRLPEESIGRSIPEQPEQARLLRALEPDAAATIDELHARTRMPLATLLGALTALEVRGRIAIRGNRVDLIRWPPAGKH